MFQRLKQAVDTRIAEEQARAAQHSTPVSIARSNSTARRTDSPSARPRKPKPKDSDGTPTRGPDPSEFETAFIIEDDSEEASRASTPVMMDEKAHLVAGSTAPLEAGGSGDGSARGSATPLALPTEVRTKLRKLEKLESKYQGKLLRSYRVAHARAISIEPFEKALKENTPLGGISDPDALVEYLNQLNLKGDMVMDELKRVSADRDNHKKKFEESEKQASALREQLESAKSGTAGEGSVAESTEKGDTMSIDTPSASVKSPVSSVLGIFSPKQKAQELSDNKDVNEEFFSYDDELPKLQSEVKQKTIEVEDLKSKVGRLEKDLAVSQESSAGLVESLEKATRELNESKDAAAAGQDDTKRMEAQAEEIRGLKDELQTAKKQLSLLEADLASQMEESAEKISTLENGFEKEKNESQKKVSTLETNINNFKEAANQKAKAETDARKEAESLREKLDLQIKEVEKARDSGDKKIKELSESIRVLQDQIKETESHETEEPKTNLRLHLRLALARRRIKKKKKGGVAAAAAAAATANAANEESVGKEADSQPPTPSLATTELQTEILKLKEEVADKDAQIAKLQTKRKTEEDLREELENMQENFINIGQEHVEAKDKIKELESEKTSLKEQIMKLEQEIETYKSQSKDSEKVGAEFKSLTSEYEDLKLKSAALQTDLGAAQQLAQSRYRDLTELRDVLQKAQPELKSLRTENANLKVAKDELASRTSELRRLEAREKDLKSDMASFKRQAADRETEMRTLNEKITQETNGRLRAEDQARVAQRDFRKSEAEKIQLVASGEKSATELVRIQEEAGKMRTKVRDLEDQVSRLTSESKGLRQEVELRGSQYNNAQGLLGSMRDQSAEMAMQLKEAKDQSESLEEELTEVQRLLSERTRDGETMRRLLADIDDRADAKVREMRERMEAAIEERDRAEDEASTNGRRRAREVDELKTKIRNFERELKIATNDRDELQQSEKEWKRRRDELEGVSDKAAQEVGDIRSAMGELRDALDGSEKQVRDAEKQRADLRRILEEANQRYEKLQRDFKALQLKSSRMDMSSRSSFDSGRGGSPVNGSAQGGKVDYVYLKTILLQFLEQKDKKRQGDLVKTVLGQLLHFDKKDQDKWIAAISAR
ncbi:Golgin [Lachnellula hyalina]|uniref:Golgin n=1 Tax=Lachnellula hyalina TaxID=1316788 RepID=A0A8H8R0A5_9HELO|nr:Golgin [Lachnellula hyalina]TVY25726.1 Golgin [Lachnellula hyalina]